MAGREKKRDLNPVAQNVNIELKKSQPSIELKRDAKGNVNITIKVYDDDVQGASEDAQAVFDDLCQKYGED